MKKYFGFALVLIFAAQLGAEVVDNAETSSGRNLGLDYSAGFSGRSNPLAGTFWAEAGYSQLLWGNWEGKDDVMYGYIRPSVKAASILIINAAEAKISFRPISFFGINAGRLVSMRNRDKVPGANCDIHECRGGLDSEFVQADLALAAGPYFYSGHVESKKTKSLRNELDFYDDLPAVIGRKGEDRISTVNHSVGYRFKNDPQERLIALNFRRSEAEHSKSYSERVGVAYGHRHKDVRITYMAGSYFSDLQKRSPTVAIQVDWLGGLRGLAL